ncbi:MAG TPA: FtsX-like permease family protein [Bryobacteraceae bacterium]|jgi:putative ABC transport system permease protein|nr:FtsX-like permease family protein [Bryobacteraceae bacterium]
MFFRFIIGALRYRRQRLLLSFFALAIAAAMATVLFGIYGTVGQRMREQFSSYGANISAVPVTGTTVPLEIATAAEKLGATAAPFLITSVHTSAEPILVAGFIPAKTTAMTPYWHMKGSRDIGPGECIAGETLADRLHAAIGSTIPLEHASCIVKGIVSTGGAEDQELLLDFATAAQLSGIANAASLIQIRAPGDRVEPIRQELARRFPSADVRTNLAVASTESNVILKIRASLFLLTLIVLVITTLCVTSNFSEIVLERSKEIGILKALGGVERRIAAFFVSESAALALVATIAGYAIGNFAAAAIGREVFGGAMRIEAGGLVFAGVAGVMLAVAAIATAIAASRIWSIQPAIILRGE